MRAFRQFLIKPCNGFPSCSDRQGLAIVLCKCPLLWSRSISLDPDSGSPCLEGKDSIMTWFRASWHSGEGPIPVLIHTAVIWFKPSWPSREVGPWPSREVRLWLRFQVQSRVTQDTHGPQLGQLLQKHLCSFATYWGTCYCLGTWVELFQDALWTRLVQHSCSEKSVAPGHSG